jgi:(p)ppGpp synthetase, RelA/SpoT family
LDAALYRDLRQKLSYLDSSELALVDQAYRFALEHHVGQKRHSGEKYITHPLAVAKVLAEMFFDYQSVIAALLHDTIEDTSATKKEITRIFGAAVAELVDGVTKLSQIESSGHDESQAQNFRKMVLAMSHDIRVIIIKLVDRLHNMRTIEYVSPATKKRRIAKETLDIYAPIANRLGMYSLYAELEDLAFSACYPRRHRVLSKVLNGIYTNNKNVLELLKQELDEAFAPTSIAEVKVLGRNKHLYSIYRKMLRQRTAFANIMDIYGFRVVVSSLDDCYRALGIIHNLHKPLPGTFKDYIAIPKLNGYQSLHTVIMGPFGFPVEIQIRTHLMDQIAIYGIAAHWLYRDEDDSASEAQILAHRWVAGLLEMQQTAGNSLEFLENVKVDLYPDKVFVFTPRGKIIELVKGATALDFAYAVHTDVGNASVAVRINRRFLPLSTVLSNGQMVSVITSEHTEPSPKWLSFVVTGRAKHSIKQYLKNKKINEIMALGKQLLTQELTDISFDFEKIPPEALEKFFKKTGLKDINQLYESIGLGNRMAHLVVYQLLADVNEGLSSKLEIKGGIKTFLIKRASGSAITFASCCCPIPGDPIAGYLNIDQGLDVHVEGCSSFAKLPNFQEKVIPVAWDEKVVGDFKISISIEMVNQLSSLAELTQAISKANAKIDGIRSEEQHGEYLLLILDLLVKNLAHLRRVERHVSHVPAVVCVARGKIV